MTKRNWSYTIPDGPHKGVTLFSGRYTCTVACILKEGMDGILYVLANRRGKGTPDEQGKWNMPCGFMEPEDAEECCARETYEECGMRIDPKRFRLLGVNAKGSEKNVTLRYYAILREGVDETVFDRTKVLDGVTGGEKDEVSDVQWVPILDLGVMDVTMPEKGWRDREWAFGHDRIIEKIISLWNGDEECYEIPVTC